MKGAGRLIVLVGAPLLLASSIIIGSFEAYVLSGASRVLSFLILAALAGLLVSGWLHAYDESRFPRALVFVGRFFVLTGLLFFCDDIAKGEFFGEGFGMAFFMSLFGLGVIREARGAETGTRR